MSTKHMIVNFEVKEIKEDDDGYFTFQGYASTYGNVDRGADIVEAGAFDETIKQYSGEQKLPVLWQHNHDMPVGVYTEIRSDMKGLFVTGKMPKDDAFVRDRVIPQMKVGSIRKMSIGYSVDDFEYDGDIRKLKKLNLWEVSLVTIPMNNEADITGFKSFSIKDFDGMTERDIEKQLRDGVKFSRESAKTIVSAIKNLRDAEDDQERDAQQAKQLLEELMKTSEAFKEGLK